MRMAILTLGLCLASAPGAWAQNGGQDLGREENVADTMSIAVPRAPLELLEIRPYTVVKPMEFSVGGRKAEVKQGYILVLKVDLDLTEPLDLPDRYLLVDDCVAQKINSGYKDGVVVVVTSQVDLEKAPIWFGSRWLPRNFNERALERERESLARSEIRPFSKKQIQKALERGGAKVEAYDLNELWYLQRDLVLRYAPAEKDMALSLDPGMDAKAWRAAQGR